MQESKSASAWSAVDAASVGAVVRMLDGQAMEQGPESRFGGLWSRWADVLRPTAEKMAATTLRVPGPFARVLLAELRDPPTDDEPISDPEQLEYEDEIAASVRQWIRELDGEGERTLIFPVDEARDWLVDYIRSVTFEGLTEDLHDGTTQERKRVVAALAGWVDVMNQLEGAKEHATA